MNELIRKRGVLMLKIFTGGAMSHKDEMLRDCLINCIKEDKKVFVFVPDQFSFEYDKMLYDILGAKLFNKISVMGLNRFAEKLRKGFGSEKGQTADDNAKTILMHKAIKKFKVEEKSVYYSKNLEKISFVNQMLEASNLLSRNDISAENLQIAGEKTEGILSEKLREISQMFDLYQNELKQMELCDGLSVVNEACEILKGNTYFNDCEIFFDRYDTFSADEYKIIEVMLHQCDNMYFSITLSQENNSKSLFSPFYATVKTVSELERIAKAVGVEVVQKNSSQYYYNKSALAHLNANLFCVDNHFSADNEGVKVVLSQDVYDEVEYVAGEIKRLVREENFRYSDIAVISRQLDEYVSIIEGTFERFEIPTFIDAKEDVSKSVLAIYISNVLDCIYGKSFRTEKLLRMIKSPLSPFKDFEVWAIEEYCYTWNVDGDMWTKPFTAFEERNNNLVEVNKIREKIVTPIVNFRNNTKDATAKQLVSALSKLLEEYSLTSCANAVVKLSKDIQGEKSFITDKSTEIELIREFKQIWQLFINALYSISENMGDEVISVRELGDILALLMSTMTISNPPQRINTVTVAKAEHTRLSKVKAVFVLGVNADKLPAKVKTGGIFTEKEKLKLEKIGIELSQTAIDNIKNERLTTYLALTNPSDKLYVCCPKNDAEGRPLVPSSVVRDIVKMFGNGIVINTSDLGVEFFCKTKRSALSKLSECMNDNSVSSMSLKTALESIPETAQRVEKIYENSKHREFAISQNTAEELFFKDCDNKKQITLSPSSMDTYNKCPFGYFCKYGLGLKTPTKYEINGVNRGRVIHYVMENILSIKCGDEKVYNEEFEKMTPEQVKEKVYELALKYKEIELGGDFGKDIRYDVLFDRICQNAVYVVLNIQQELIHSSFVPKAFEYTIKDDKGNALLKLTDGEMEVCITGQIDRIDTFTDKDGETYLKIVDYKTGNVNNMFSKIFHGVSLQMIVYIMALLSGKNDINPENNAKAGAMIYSPAKFIKSSKLYRFSEVGKYRTNVKFSQNYKDEQLARFGIVNDNENVVFALNEFGNKNFCLSEKNEYFKEVGIERLENFTGEKIKETGNKILRGKIEASPLADITSSTMLKPCSYCDYYDICGAKTAKPKRFMTKYDKDVIMELISEKEEIEVNEDGE